MIDVPQISPRRRDLSKIRDLEESFENGYDSDGFHSPFFDAVDAEGEQDFDKDSLDGMSHTPDREKGDGDRTNAPDGPNQVVLTNESIMGMMVNALKD